MELTLESALSVGGLVGHLSYLLLVEWTLMRRMWALRVLAIASALVVIGYDEFWLQDPIGASLQDSFARNLRDKIVRSNWFIVESGEGD